MHPSSHPTIPSSALPRDVNSGICNRPNANNYNAVFRLSGPFVFIQTAAAVEPRSQSTSRGKCSTRRYGWLVWVSIPPQTLATFDLSKDTSTISFQFQFCWLYYLRSDNIVLRHVDKAQSPIMVPTPRSTATRLTRSTWTLW